MPNAQEFSELIRTGGLDFALLKPIDTQFLISFQRVEWSTLSNFLVGIVMLFYSLYQLMTREVNPLQLSPLAIVVYPLFILCGIVILYSLMITLAATSIWLGRNQTLYNFWFYITNFSRYPMEIYSGAAGMALQSFFTFIVPVLVVVKRSSASDGQTAGGKRLVPTPVHDRCHSGECARLALGVPAGAIELSKCQQLNNSPQSGWREVSVSVIRDNMLAASLDRCSRLRRHPW